MYKIATLLITLTHFITSTVFCQKNGLINVKTFGDKLYADEFTSIIKTDNGYLCLGASYSTASLPDNHGSQDAFIVEYDKNFNILWKKAYGGSGIDKFTQGIKTEDGSYIICGFTESNDGDIVRPVNRGRDILIMKINKSGDILWQKSYGGSGIDYATSIAHGGINQYVVMSITNSTDGDIIGKSTNDLDVLLIKIDGSGNILQQKLFGGSRHEGTYSFIERSNKATIINTLEGGFAFITTTLSNDGMVTGNHGDRDIWVVNTDASLNLIWQKCLGGLNDDGGIGLLQLNDSSYIISGYAYSNSGDINGIYNGTERSSIIGRLHKNGEKDWIKTLGDGIFYTAVQEDNNDFTIVGFGHLYQAINYAPQFGNGKILRMDNTGNIKWYRSIGGSHFDKEKDFLYNLIKEDDTSYITVGFSLSQANGDFNEVSIGTDAIVLKIKELSSLHGMFFYDNNNNGIRDVDESYPKPAGINTIRNHGSYYDKQESTIYFQAHPFDNKKDGSFLISHDTGSYKIYFDNYNLFDSSLYVISPRYGYHYQFTNSGQKDSVTFRLIPKMYIKDLAISLSGADYTTLNKSTKYNISIKNHGKDSVTDGRLTIYKNKNTHLVSSSLPDYTTYSDSIIWRLPTIAGSALLSFDILMNTPSISTNKVGDTLILKGKVDHLADFDTNNNTSIHKSIINSIYIDKDLAVQGVSNTEIKTSDEITYKCIIKNLGSDTAFNVKIHVIKKPNLSFYYFSKRVSSIKSDTAVFDVPYILPNSVDTVLAGFRLKTIRDVKVGDSLELKSVIYPLDDYNSENNSSVSYIRIIALNSLTNLSTYIWGPSTVYKGQPIQYSLYTKNDGMDTTAGSQVKFIKDPNLTYLSSNRSLVSFINDTLTWNLPTLRPDQADTIELQMLLPDNSLIAIGDSIRVNSTLINPLDTVYINNNHFRLSSVVKTLPIFPDTTNTTLQPPMGIQWVRTLIGSGRDEAYTVASLPDSGFVIAGMTNSTDGDFSSGKDSAYNAFISRFDKDGIKKWTKILLGSGYDKISSIKVDKDGNYFIAGETTSNSNDFAGSKGNSEAFVFKITDEGELLWKTFIGNQHHDFLFHMQLTSDGGCVLTSGISDSISNTLYHWLVKIDKLGNIQWNKRIENVTNRSVVNVLTDNSYFVAGINNVRTANGVSFRLSKYDLSGNIMWEKQILPSNNFQTSILQIHDIYVSEDSSIYLLSDIGYYPSDSALAIANGLHGGLDILLMKLDKNGNKIWSKYLGGKLREEPTQLYRINNGFLISGLTGSNDGNVSNNKGGIDGWIIQVDDQGKLQWQQTIGGTRTDIIYGITLTNQGNIVAVGRTSSINSGDIHKKNPDVDAFIAQIGIFNQIKGLVYYDANLNGKFDTGEKTLQNIAVHVTTVSQIHFANTNANGEYSVSTNKGKHYISAKVNLSYFSVEPRIDSFTFTGYNLTKTINFGVQALSPKKDLKISLVGYTIPRPGFNSSYLVSYQNVGNTDILFDTIQLIKDKRQSLVHSSPGFNVIKGDTLIWYISRLNAFEPARYIDLTFKNAPPPQLNLNDTLVLSAFIFPVIDDQTPADNMTYINQIVRGSYDPNDKNEMHGGVITPEELMKKPFFTYLIRFQNTGTDTAFRVIVRDTLESKFDTESFEMLSASHPYKLNIIDKRILEWTFDDIYLPDSNINEKASHGYISFRIRAKDGLKIGDNLSNSASIYFDFNLPIKTNTSQIHVKSKTLTSINNANSLIQQIEIFPNPIKDKIWIHFPFRVSDKLSFSLQNIKGEKVWEKDFGKVTRSSFKEQLVIGSHPNGPYLLLIKIGSRTYSFKTVILN